MGSLNIYTMPMTRFDVDVKRCSFCNKPLPKGVDRMHKPCRKKQEKIERELKEVAK